MIALHRSRFPDPVSLLLGAGLVDLAIDRTAMRLFVPLHRAPPMGWAILQLVGEFARQLSGTLGIILLVLGLVALMGQRGDQPRVVPLTLGFFALLFVGLAATGILCGGLPERLFIHLKISAAFLAWVLAATVLRLRLAWRPKVGVLLFILPTMLPVIALFLAQTSWGRGDTFPLGLFRAGELVMLAAAATSWWLFRAEAMRAGWGAWFAGGVGVALVLLAAALFYDRLQLLSLFALRFELPAAGSREQWPYVILLAGAVGGLVLMVAQGWQSRRGMVLFARGVALCAVAGYQPAAPHQVVVGMAGLLALVGGARAMTRMSPAASEDTGHIGGAP